MSSKIKLVAGDRIDPRNGRLDGITVDDLIGISFLTRIKDAVASGSGILVLLDTIGHADIASIRRDGDLMVIRTDIPSEHPPISWATFITAIQMMEEAAKLPNDDGTSDGGLRIGHLRVVVKHRDEELLRPIRTVDAWSGRMLLSEVISRSEDHLPV